MPTQKEIYENHADAYDELVSAEDCEGNLLRTLNAACPLDGASVLEVGVGTGRVTKLLISSGARVVGCEPAPAMLHVARQKLAPWIGSRVVLHHGDVHELPIQDARFDLAIAAWVFGHLTHWMPQTWREDVGAALATMRAALRPGGTLIVVETLGTGRSDPGAPSESLAAYYSWLEREQGLRRVAVRTDYRFPDVETAARITGFFFGDAFASRVRTEKWTEVPEYTGIWTGTA